MPQNAKLAMLTADVLIVGMLVVQLHALLVLQH